MSQPGFSGIARGSVRRDSAERSAKRTAVQDAKRNAKHQRQNPEDAPLEGGDPDSDVSMESAEDDNPRASITTNVLVNDLQYLLSMVPQLHRLKSSNTLVMPVNCLDPFFTTMYNFFIQKLVVNATEFDRYITRADFVHVAHFIFKGRLDDISRHYMRQNPANRIIMSDALVMPKCMAEIINGLGGVLVNDGAILLFPQLQPEVVAEEHRVHRLATAAMQERFITFTEQLAQHGLTTATPLTHVKDGTRWWTLDVRTREGGDVNGYNNVVRANCYVHDVTPSDIMHACIAQHAQRIAFHDLTVVLLSLIHI